MACPTPETMKKAVVSAPAAVKVRPKSAISHGKSEGMTRWKKCDVAWAKPITDMTRASLARLAGAGPGWSMGMLMALAPTPSACSVVVYRDLIAASRRAAICLLDIVG